MRIPLSYSFHNLLTRRLTTTLTASGMVLVVFVFAAILMLAEGLRKTLVDTGSYGVVAGENITRRFRGCGIGEKLHVGMRDWTVVGAFRAGSTGFNSEIWGNVDHLMQAFRRPVYSSVTFKLRGASDFEALKERIENDYRLPLEARREIMFFPSSVIFSIWSILSFITRLSENASFFKFSHKKRVNRLRL